MEKQSKRPENMPRQVKAEKPKLKKEQGGEVLPPQQPLTDEEALPKKTPRWKKIVRRVLAWVAVALALALCYLFLLLGEPDEDSKLAQQPAQQTPITLPMSAVESPGDTSPEGLAEIFGQPVLCLYGSALSMTRSRVYDTAFQGEYARRATLTYAFEDGQSLTVESIRPVSAIALLKGEDYHLNGDTMYYIGGMDAAWMENGADVLVFGQTADAAYAVRCPIGHKAELDVLLKQTTLTAASTGE